MPCPYSIIFGRDTALPWTLYHSGAIGIDIARYYSNRHIGEDINNFMNRADTGTASMV